MLRRTRRRPDRTMLVLVKTPAPPVVPQYPDPPRTSVPRSSTKPFELSASDNFARPSKSNPGDGAAPKEVGSERSDNTDDTAHHLQGQDQTSRDLGLVTCDSSVTTILTLGNGGDGEAIGYNPVDGMMYHASGISSGTQYFEPIDLTTLTVGANLAPGNTYPTIDEEITGMVYYPPKAGFIVVDRLSRNIHLIDPITASFTTLATLANDERIRGFAVVGTSIYGVEAKDSGLVEFDPDTGLVISSKPVIIDDVEITDGSNGLTTHPTTGQVYIIFKCASSRCLGIIDVTTGIGTEIGDTGMKLSGISFDGSDQLYAISGDGATPSETLFVFDDCPLSGTKSSKGPKSAKSKSPKMTKSPKRRKMSY